MLKTRASSILWLLASVLSLKPITETHQYSTHNKFNFGVIKVLHLSFHKGCCNDFAEVAEELGLDLTTWYLLGGESYPIQFFDGKTTKGDAIYNIGHNRAQWVWDSHKDFFNKFDIIVTSDTAPLSRIFLQNNWQKPLIVWVCNRFDYYDSASLDCAFPDREYYALFNQATKKPNIKIVSYTPYEYHYMRQKGITADTFTIRPLGAREKYLDQTFVSRIPETVNKSSTLFLYPRLEARQAQYIQKECGALGISTYTGAYNGPDDLKGFKGVLYFPYAWSNLALFENLQRGLIHFVPSEKFVLRALRDGLPIRVVTRDNFHLCEWYCEEFRDLFVYFDSWQDLQEKIRSTDYEQLSKKVKQAGETHRTAMLQKWREVFSDFAQRFSLSL